jgi:hypothetical protein
MGQERSELLSAIDLFRDGVDTYPHAHRTGDFSPLLLLFPDVAYLPTGLSISTIVVWRTFSETVISGELR